MNYKLSVIIPCYNAENSIVHTIESVLNQSIGFENIELILINNGSTDNTNNIIKTYCEKYKNIIPIFIKNNTGNAAIPRNMGLEKTTSDYIMFLDADDEFMPDFCEVAYTKITENNVDLVKCNYITITNNETRYNYYFNKEIKEKIIKNTDLPLKNVNIWNGIYKTEIIKKNQITFPNYMGEDTYFTTKEFLNMNEMIYLNDYFGYKYYDYEDSHSKKPSKKNISDLIQVLKKTMNLCKDCEREDVMNIIIGQQITGVYLRIINTDESVKIKKELIEETYDIVKNSNLVTESIIFRIANILIKNRLFTLTIVYLNISYKVYSSKTLYKLLHKN